MKRFLSLVLLSLACSVAQAEWVFIAKNQALTDTYYGDSATKQWSGSLVKVWDLVNFEKPEKTGNIIYSSIKQFLQFNCVQKAYQSLYLTAHSGQMGSGKTVFSEGYAEQWTPIAPDTVMSDVMIWACTK